VEETETSDTDDATRFCLFHGSFVNSAAQPWVIKFYPMFDASHTIIIPYRISADKLTDAAIYAMGGPEHSNTILHMAFAEMEAAKNIDDGYWNNRAKESLVASIALDSGYFRTRGSKNVFDGEVGLSI